ncbi:hypothetical protein CE91St63_12420 [[Clostridium] hylemonae]|nr:hypothetical protein CE91St63_12420 [[Clostridium] hylemonae]
MPEIQRNIQFHILMLSFSPILHNNVENNSTIPPMMTSFHIVTEYIALKGMTA